MNINFYEMFISAVKQVPNFLIAYALGKMLDALLHKLFAKK